MFRSMSFLQGFSDTAYYYMDPGIFNGGSAMTFGCVCAVRSDAAAGAIQRFWGNWEDAGDTGWCVQKSAADMITAAGQIWDMEAGAAGDTISNAAPAAPQSALYTPVFLVGTLDVSGDALTMYINGAQVAQDADITPAAGAENIYLGRGAEAAVDAPDVKVNMMFLEHRVMTAVQIGQLWHQISRFGRFPSNGVISGSGNITYFWDLIDNADAGATWVSRGTATTALTLTRAGATAAADLDVESWTNSGFGL